MAETTTGSRGVVRTFATALEDHAHRTALIDEAGDRIGYRELAERADGMGERIGAAAGLNAGDFDAPGIAPRVLVTLEVDNTTASVIALIACLRAGHPVIIGSQAARDRIEETYRPNVRVSGDGTVTPLHGHALALHPDLAVMLMTSGSTGATKLVRLSYAALHANAGAIAEYLHIADDDVAITSLPISYSYGLSVLNSHLHRGAALILTGRSVIEDEFWALFSREAATSIAGVPYTYELLEATGFRDRAPDSLRTMTQAGGRLAPEIVRTYHEWSLGRGVSFFTMYGQTEATARIAYLPPDLMGGRETCIGKAIPGGRLYVADLGGADAPAGGTGELVYVGPNVMMGYAMELDDLAAGPALSELRTGDLGEEVEPGLFRIVGRSSRFSKIAGLRVSLDEVEALLAGTGIAATATGDDALVIVAVPDEPSVAPARATLAASTAIPARSVMVIAVAELPRLSSGKVDYTALRARGHAAFDAAEAASTAGAPGEGVLARAFARALNRRTVDPQESFASLGGDSLAYIEASMAIERTLGHLPEGWEQSSIADLEAQARPADAHPRRSRAVATEMLVRPLAMTTIVAGHIANATGLNGAALRGGALVLLMIAGYNATRFQRDTMMAPGRWQLLTSFALRFLLPFFLLMLLMAATIAPTPLDWRALLLVHSYAPEQSPWLGRYWFMEAMTALLVISLTIFSIPPLRHLAQRHRWWFAWGALAVALGAKAVVPHLLPDDVARLGHRLDTWAYAYVLGWVVAEANTNVRKVLAIVAAVVLSGLDWGFGGFHNLLMGGVAALVLYLPRIRLWTPLAMLAAFFAQSTFYIYLSHGFSEWFMLDVLHAGFAATVLGAIVLGMVTYTVWRRAELLILGLVHARRGWLTEREATDH